MINHLRTLLLNRSGTECSGPAYPGEEYCDPTYQAVKLPATLQLVHNDLFAPDADRAYRNYRLTEYMTILDAREFIQYVDALDSRITYRHGSRQTFDQYAFNTATQQLSGTPKAIYLYTPTVVRAQGTRLLQSWDVSVVNLVTVHIDNLIVPGLSTDKTYSDNSGLSTPVTIDGNPELTIQWATGATDMVWRITKLTRPTRQLGDVLQSLITTVTGDVEIDLFPKRDTEPYKTFWQLWTQDLLPYRLAGVLLGLGYNIENLRNS